MVSKYLSDIFLTNVGDNDLNRLGKSNVIIKLRPNNREEIATEKIWMAFWLEKEMPFLTPLINRGNPQVGNG